MGSCHVPFLHWVYPEVPSETTGMPPFEMMFVREATGPLATLAKTWSLRISYVSGELHPHLKQKLAAAAEAVKRAY